MKDRLETALAKALAHAKDGAPPRLARALGYAVFPAGARIRPRLCLAVAAACGDDKPALADGAACALELLHCASLVHDDLPCFDDADLRRGKPSLHRAFGQPIAVLVGDALIVHAFDTLARASRAAPERLGPLVSLFARAAGTPHGLVAGQAWESERSVSLERYHRAKTGSLFVAATMAGASAAGTDPMPWCALGERLGEAYQVADDLRDALASSEEVGKPTHRDEALDRPNAVRELGVEGAITRLRDRVAQAIAAVPAEHAAALRDLVAKTAECLIPASLRQSAA